MKILQINKFFYIKGGSSRYFFEVSKLLKSHGNEVAFFSMHDPQNQKTEWSKYFVSKISFEKVDVRRLPGILARMFYSFEARRNISRLLDEFKPDIAHLHSIYHHISPSIILELKKRNIPIVQTLHDYHLISPSHTLFHSGRICEITKKTSFWKAIFHKCVKNSYPASFLEVFEQYLHHLMGIYTNNVDLFIAPSRFMADKVIEYGIRKEKIEILHNFCDYNKFKPYYKNGEYILYFGRLSPEKGLDFLIDVMANLPKIQLKIVGSGLIENKLRQMVKKKEMRNIFFLGHKTGEELRELIYKSRFEVLPSLSYDIFPTSIMESFASVKPVIASKIGGIPELVKDGFNGILFTPLNKDECIRKILLLWNNLSLVKKMGLNGRLLIEDSLGPQNHYDRLIKIYRQIK